MYKDNTTSLMKDHSVEETNKLVQSEQQSKKSLYFKVLIVLGLFNNIGYVLVNSSSQSLAEHFNEKNLMSAFTFCLTSLSIATSFVNSKFLLKTRHISKIQGTLLCFTLGYLCVGFSNMIDTFPAFVLCLFGSVILGSAGTLGEQTNLGFLKGFAPDLIGGWGCGTGMAGVVGAGINFGLRYVKVPGYLIFLGMIPTSLIYLFGFTWLKNQKVQQIVAVENESHTPGARASSSHQDQENYQQFDNYEHTTNGAQVEQNNEANTADEQEANINQFLSFANLKRIWPSISYLAVNLGLVYFLEYTIITGFADKATYNLAHSPNSNGIEQNSFIVLNLCYQTGVLISRSSISFIKIRKIWIVTLLQLINFILWAWIGYSKPLGLPPMFVLMVWVGLMGGCSYVNVLYGILESTKIEKKDKEMAINIVSMCNNIGVLSAAATALVLEVTIYASV